MRQRIVIETVEPGEQRYDTQGDWMFDDTGALVIRVSSDVLSDEGFLIALHELVEAKLCMSRGITQAAVDAFDMGMEPVTTETGEEPGDMAGAPYQREHRFAMLIEHLMAHELGLKGYGEVS